MTNSNRSSRSHRPYGTRRSLARAFPPLAATWHPFGNGDLTPNDVKPYSNRTVMWFCDNGHEYAYRIDQRRRSGKCQRCFPYVHAAADRKAGTAESSQAEQTPAYEHMLTTPRRPTTFGGRPSLAEYSPRDASEWHPTLNGQLRPEDRTPYSGYTVWWRCAKGHDDYLMRIDRKTRGQRCPECRRADR